MKNLLRLLPLLALVAFSCDAEAATKTWTGGTGTFSSTNGANWSGGTAPINGDTLIFDGTSGGGVVTADSSISGMSFLSLTAGAFAGTLDIGVTNTVSSLTFTGLAGVVLQGSGARVFKLAGAWTIQSGAFDLSVTTNLDTTNSVFTGLNITLTAIAFNTAQAFNGGGRTYGSLTIGGRSTGQAVTIAQNNTFGSITFNAPAWIQSNATTQTATTAFSVGSGGSASAYVAFGGMNQTNQTGTFAIPATGVAIDRAILRSVVFTGNNPGTITNSIDFGNNSLNGGTITAPSSGGGGGGGGGNIIGG